MYIKISYRLFRQIKILILNILFLKRPTSIKLLRSIGNLNRTLSIYKCLKRDIFDTGNYQILLWNLNIKMYFIFLNNIKIYYIFLYFDSAQEKTLFVKKTNSMLKAALD